MPTTSSPLRYPGGKTKLYDKVVSILKLNELQDVIYVEPFCGGSGLAIKLLLCNDVSSIVLNDIDPAIHAFWHCVLNRTEELCSRLTKCRITIEERDRQIKIFRDANSHSTLDIGFSTLFLNRTNISGILNAGPIGGREQTGKDKLDARFNKTVLKDKIVAIAEQKEKISLYNLDVIDFINKALPKYESRKLFLNFDPPYVKKGQELYLNHFSMEDHKRLCDKVSQCNQYWIVTYDYNDSILDLYAPFDYERIQLNHSAGSMKKGEEVIIYSNNLRTHKGCPGVLATV
ncbi:MAG: DNA adenine methylase [Dehalococcoidia bacterium]|nr:DNA adenine methylase [Dehalococcoidia bacterium]